MSESVSDTSTLDLARKVTDVAIRLSLLAALVVWCFLLFRPFVMPLVWGIIIAVALSPVFFWLESVLGGRRKLAGTLFILLGIGALLVPTLLVSNSFLDGVEWIRTQEAKDTIRVPPPPPMAADLPLIGDRVHEVWTQASENLEAILMEFGPQVGSFTSWLLSTLTGFGVALLLTIVAIIIAGVMLINSEGAGKTARTVGARLGGARGEAAVDLAAQTIRSVAYGVIGVATVQAILAGVGLYLAGVPAAGLWAGLVLILAVAQLPPLLILAPAIVYVFAASDSTLTQVLFTIWSVIVSFSDLFLKPMFLGRGVEVPMPVILIGAIGGLVRAGVIGLFVGAVVLAIGYNIFTAWMNRAEG